MFPRLGERKREGTGCWSEGCDSRGGLERVPGRGGAAAPPPVPGQRRSSSAGGSGRGSRAPPLSQRCPSAVPRVSRGSAGSGGGDTAGWGRWFGVPHIHVAFLPAPLRPAGARSAAPGTRPSRGVRGTARWALGQQRPGDAGLGSGTPRLRAPRAAPARPAMPAPAEAGRAPGAPDGGWGWVVVFGAFVSIGFAYAFPKGLAIFFKEIQDFFGTSYSEIAWVSSIMLATTYGAGPISSILVNRYGSRPVVMFGGLLCGVGMISAAFCTSILQLYICVGFITGFGLALNLQPSVIIIGKYFLRRRPIANGLAMAGSPVMLCTLAPLNQFLFDNFGWRGSFLILGAILLNCCVAGALFRPIGAGTAQVKTQVTEEGKDALKGKITEDGLMENKTEEEGEKDCFEKVNQYLDFSLFKHRGFLIYLIGNVLMFLGFFAPIVFLAPYAKHTGIDEYSAAFLLSILAMVDMVARPTTGIVANSKWVRPRIQYFFSFAIAFNGACHLLCPLASSYSGLIVYSSFFGLAFGMVCAMLFETLMDLVGAARFTSAVGLVTIAECCTILLGPPIGGIIIDTFGDYKYMFIKCGAVMVLAGTFLFIMNYYNYRMLAKEEKERKAKEEDPKYVRTENEGKKTWNKDSPQDGPELEPLREKGEGLKKEMNGTNEV